MSNQADLAVELSASYAHRADQDIHIVLQLAGDPAVDSSGVGGQLQLRAGRRTVRVATTASSTPEGTALDARVPAADLRPGVWLLGLVGPGDDVRGVQARLLNSNKQPIALLPGPTPRTELAAPRPVEPRSETGKARAYHAAAKVANKGLALLPEQRADRYRTLLKRAGKRVLS
jgi:hypothetical protein